MTRSLTRNGCKSYFSKKHVAMAWLTVIMAKNEHAVMKCVWRCSLRGLNASEPAALRTLSPSFLFMTTCLNVNMRISSVQRWQDADKYDDVDPGDVYDDGAHDDADDVDDKVDTVYQTVVECVFAITPLDPVWILNVLLIFAKPASHVIIILMNKCCLLLQI